MPLEKAAASETKAIAASGPLLARQESERLLQLAEKPLLAKGKTEPTDVLEDQRIIVQAVKWGNENVVGPKAAGGNRLSRNILPFYLPAPTALSLIRWNPRCDSRGADRTLT